MWLSAVSLLSFLSLSTAELVHVHAIFRHGDRTPTKTFATDPNKRHVWPVGWGELTTTGMAELYQQGLKLKERYIEKHKFINSTYKPEEAYFRSTDYDRTLASAQSLLTGLYSQSEGTYPDTPGWPKRYSPIPVHTVPKKLDHLLNVFRSCPKKQKLDFERQTVKQFLDYLDSQQDYFQFITVMSGSQITTLYDLHHFLDTVHIEQLYNMTIAPWITSDVQKKGEEIMKATDDYGFGMAGYGQPECVELIRLNGGNLLGDAIQKFSAARAGQSQPKFVGYSAHDTTILTFLRTLGAKSKLTQGKRLIDYAVVLTLELWKVDGQYSVSLQYSANVDAPFVDFTNAIEGCPGEGLCPLELFIERSLKYAVGDAEKECDLV